ncbi:lysylphosphatidylglycerol synthase domain-containing protein [Pseudomonas sp. NPDC007930]|uniref:lysylphosphatidylglycerol synthase domain-containing protein n=1 Tax=Pseudomonas sp. NPDC007930 TaxID=3364417 RepID=UPI0036ECCDCA
MSERSAKRWAWARRILNWACLILVPVLLYLLLRNIEWAQVGKGLRTYSWPTLALGALIALASYGVFSAFDLIGKRYTGHPLPSRQVLPIAFVCYAFNLNLSSWVGGIALRYRLYGKRGVKVATVTRILSLGLLTNWCGYLLLAGSLFALGLPSLPPSLKIGETGLRLIGVAMVLAGLGYLLACRFSKRRGWRLKGHEITLPSFSMALLQVAVGALNWALMGSLMYLLLPQGVDYPSVLAILLISSIAGVIAHIPAGLGVLETVFITLVHGDYSKATLLASLIAYRALYFLLPLAIACVGYLLLERRVISHALPGSDAAEGPPAEPPPRRTV